MKLEEIKALMAKNNRAIIEVKRHKNHDWVNYWVEFPNVEDPKGLRCELTLKCHIEDLPDETVIEHLVGTSIGSDSKRMSEK